jgi:hypothetical protein
MAFNDQSKLAPEPRDMSDRDLLTLALGYLRGACKGEETEEIITLAGWLEDLDEGTIRCLSPRRRTWANDALDRFEPRAANLVSRGLVPRGREVPTPAVLRNLPLKPPGRP